MYIALYIYIFVSLCFKYKTNNTLCIIAFWDRKDNESTFTSCDWNVLLFAGHVYELNNGICGRKSGLSYSLGNRKENSQIINIISVFSLRINIRSRNLHAYSLLAWMATLYYNNRTTHQLISIILIVWSVGRPLQTRHSLWTQHYQYYIL